MTHTGDRFINEKRLGDGSYGLVLSVDRIDPADPDKFEKVAVKVNVSEISTLGIGVLRESDLMQRTNGHPNVVRFNGILFGAPGFKIKPKALSSPDARLDEAHFVIGIENSNLDTLIRSQKHIPMRSVKIMFLHLMLGLEYIHSKGIVHRDVKPANILYSGTSANPHMRICDFGLGTVLGGPTTATPGTVTSWYRAPEICLNRPYDTKVDIWAAAAVAFEMMSRRALLSGSHDDSDSILSGIFNKFPAIASAATIAKVSGGSILNRGDKFALLSEEAKRQVTDSSLSNEARLADVSARIRRGLRLSVNEVQEFVESPGSLGEFCDLVSRMFLFDPVDRLSATEVINHDFFKGYSDLINDTRSNHPLGVTSLPKVAILADERRKIAMHLAVHIYNNHSKIDWYSHRILFSAINLFDRYLADNPEPPSDSELVNIDTVYIKMYVCLYIFHKYFLTLEAPFAWSDFAPSKYTGESATKEAFKFELYLFRDLCTYSVYSDTLYEYISHRDGRASERKVRECLVKLSEIGENLNVSSIRGLARHLEI